MSFHPSRDHLLVRRSAARDKTAGIISDSEVMLDSETLLIMNESDLIGVIA